MAPRFLAEDKYVSGIHVVAAYNPETDSGNAFQKKYGIPVFDSCFENFLKQVDAVYIASPNETHYSYAKQALLAGKHVLSENPVALSGSQAKELFALANEKELVLMEGIKTAYCPGFQQLINTAQSGKIGEIRDIEACFTRLADPASRERTDVEYGGAFLEYAAYTLLPIFKLYGTNYRDVQIQSIRDEKGLDLYTKIQLRYRQGMASACCGVGVKSEGQLVIAGTEGYILAESPWWLTKKYQVRYENPNQIDTYEPRFQGDGLRYEMSEFVSKINGIERNAYKLTTDEILAISEITELFMKKRGEMRR
jgi:predicted dehydrogenase